MEDLKKPFKLPKECHPQNNKAKGMSFFAFIFSIFVYISIFYIFNLSPSTLFKTTKFWFLISNTLILIIVVDYGAFSSSKNKHQDAYEEYSVHSEARRVTISPPSPFALEYNELVKKGHVLHEQKQQHDDKEKEEEKSVHEEREKALSMQIVPMEAQQEDIQEKRIVHVDDWKVDETNKVIDDVKPRRTHRRSKSEKAKRVMIDETKNKVITLRRSETEKREEIEDHIEEVNNEFSNMSDEDLNRRVEEFIQRFNRQIRLQAREDKY